LSNGQETWLIAREHFMMLDPERKRFAIYPFPRGWRGRLDGRGWQSGLFGPQRTPILWLDLPTMPGGNLL
jgi:hypothetical protein